MSVNPVNTRTDHIILFDGVCNLCNGFVQFIIRRDTNAVFKFASLQSDAAIQLLADHPIQKKPNSTVVFISSGQTFTESMAVFKIIRLMSKPWRFLSYLSILPEWLTDGVYRMVNKYRYRIFGKKQSCLLPTPDILHRFL